MIFLQLLSLLFGLFMIYWSFFIYKKRIIYLNELLFWTVVWSAFVLIALFPQSVTFFLQTLHINRTMDLVMIIAFMVIWIISYKNYLDNKKISRKFQDFVRQVAIKQALTQKTKK